METLSYFLILAGGLLLAAWLYHLLLAGAGEKRRAAWLTLALGAALGFVLAKGVYVLLRLQETFALYGAAGLVRMNHEEFSFVGGCLGMALGGVLAARIAGLRPLRALDLMAAPLALGVAFARAAESFLGQLGHGADLTDAAWTHFFPLAAETRYSDTYSEWALSVNLQLAILALVCVMLAIRWLRTCGDVPGVCFARTAFMLCAPLFILELMRSVSITIFVRVHAEQILCMAVMSACILTAAVRARRGRAGVIVPAALLVLVIALNMALQFALDGKLNSLLERLPFGEAAMETILYDRANWCYPAMILTDIGMVVMEFVLTGRQLRRAREARKGGVSA